VELQTPQEAAGAAAPRSSPSPEHSSSICSPSPSSSALAERAGQPSLAGLQLTATTEALAAVANSGRSSRSAVALAQAAECSSMTRAAAAAAPFQLELSTPLPVAGTASKTLAALEPLAQRTEPQRSTAAEVVALQAARLCSIYEAKATGRSTAVEAAAEVNQALHLNRSPIALEA
jgi:hypothetical protein